jgi:hypothetical protein
MEKLISKLEKSYEAYEVASNALEVKVREICDFNARITFCSGDGHLVLNEVTSNVAPLSCLFGKSKSNKLTETAHERQCI